MFVMSEGKLVDVMLISNIDLWQGNVNNNNVDLYGAQIHLNKALKAHYKQKLNYNIAYKIKLNLHMENKLKHKKKQTI